MCDTSPSETRRVVSGRPRRRCLRGRRGAWEHIAPVTETETSGMFGLQIISEYKNSVSKHKNSVSKYKNSISKYKNSVQKFKKCLLQFAKHTDAFHETPRRPHIATKTSQIGCERRIERVRMGCVNGRTSRRAKNTQHDRRPKSVWGLSRRVWEATRRVFGG